MKQNKFTLNKILSFIIIICLSPVLILIYILVIIDDGFPGFFIQKRIGYKKKEFNLYKFRTMKKETPNIATHLLDDNKVKYTRLGLFLRKFSFDELPQLLNVLAGDMNFVGPRPALYNQNDLNQLREKLGLHFIKPGLTGLAQIKGRDDLSIYKKVKYDNFYYKNRSFLLNVKIIYYTILKVLTAEGVKS